VVELRLIVSAPHATRSFRVPMDTRPQRRTMVPPTRTLFLSRLIGLYCLLIGLSTMSQKQLADGVIALLQDSSLTLFLAFMPLGASLAMVLAHSLCWMGSLAPVISPWAAPISAFLLQLRKLRQSRPRHFPDRCWIHLKLTSIRMTIGHRFCDQTWKRVPL